MSIFTLHQPAVAPIPLVVDVPHSGTQLPADFASLCTPEALRHSDEDHVAPFARAAKAYGATCLEAHVSRIYIDLNRAVGEIPPNLCAQTIPWPLIRNRRVQHGIGLIRTRLHPQQAVYGHKLSLADIERRIAHYHQPYHAALGQTLQRLRDQFGWVLHVDLHAMPGIGSDGRPMPDIVLGDHDGASCGRALRRHIKQHFERAGLCVGVNHLYKGAELTRVFANPGAGIHCMQLELNRGLYWDDEAAAPHAGQAALAAIMGGLWHSVAALGGARHHAEAAE